MTIVAPPPPPRFNPCYFLAKRPVRFTIRQDIIKFEQHGDTWVYKASNPRFAAQIQRYAKEGTYGIRNTTEEEYEKIVAPAPVPVPTVATEEPAPPPPVPDPDPVVITEEPSITVVITNFQRHELVKQAFSSCQRAKVKNIVISSSGLNADLRRVHEGIMRENGSVTIDAIEDDRGCNEMWLRGVRLAKTPWVHLLHDDDIVLPAFNKAQSGIKDGMGFVHWAGEKHNAGGIPISGTHKPLGGMISGPKHTSILHPILARKGGLSISPVSGLFRQEDLISTLEECERIKGPQFELRPNMMVGNDLLIWLRCIEKYEQFYYIADPLISYGHWSGSVTCEDIFGRKGKLGPLYDAMRNYWQNHPPSPSINMREIKPLFPIPGLNSDQKQKIIHCLEWHKDRNPEAIARKATAKQSWEQLYQRGDVFPAQYAEYQRDSSAIGDARGLPFLKDVMAWGIQYANYQDIILFSNDDTIMHPQLPGALRETLKNQGATCSHRCEYRRPPAIGDKAALFTQSIMSHPGRDIFAFTIPWLVQHWDEIPDFLLGAPCFDIAMAMMIRATQGVTSIIPTKNKQCWEMELPLGYIAHIMHHAPWGTEHRHSPSNGWNNQLAKLQAIRLYPGHYWGEMQGL